jgi:hypothetical protein
VRALLGPFTVAGIVVGQGAMVPAAAEYSYAVNFVCGAFSDDDALEPVVPGIYLSAISVGNPNEQNVEFSYDVAFTSGSVPFSRTEETIERRDARRLDCDLLFEGLDDEFLKGILYLVAEQRLDVWAFYTAREFGAGDDQVSIDAVQILGRELDGNTAGRLGE